MFVSPNHLEGWSTYPRLDWRPTTSLLVKRLLSHSLWRASRSQTEEWNTNQRRLHHIYLLRLISPVMTTTASPASWSLEGGRRVRWRSPPRGEHWRASSLVRPRPRPSPRSNFSTRSRRRTACRPGPPCGGSEPAPPWCWSPSRWCRSEAEPPGTCWRRSAPRGSRCRARLWKTSPWRSPTHRVSQILTRS